MLKDIFAPVRRAQQIVMLFDDVRDVGSAGLKVVIKGTRLGLLTSLVCKVRLQGMSEARRICLVTKLRW